GKKRGRLYEKIRLSISYNQAYPRVPRAPRGLASSVFNSRLGLTERSRHYATISIYHHDSNIDGYSRRRFISRDTGPTAVFLYRLSHCAKAPDHRRRRY